MLEELTDRYGEPPDEVVNLIAVSRLRRMAQKAGLSEVVTAGGRLRIAGAELADSIQVRLQRMFPGSRYHAPSASVLVPLPVKHGESLDDAALIEWTSGLLTAIYASEPAPVAPPVP